MIVVDTNVIVYLWLPNALTTKAESLLIKDAQWQAPLLWRSEFANVLAMYTKHKRITLADGKRLLSKVMAQFESNEHLIDPLQALELSVSSGCTVYDCEFIVLSRKLKIPCITTDAALINAYPNEAIHLKDY